jgi:hypothetical protein
MGKGKSKEIPETKKDNPVPKIHKLKLIITGARNSGVSSFI